MSKESIVESFNLANGIGPIYWAGFNLATVGQH